MGALITTVALFKGARKRKNLIGENICGKLISTEDGNLHV